MKTQGAISANTSEEAACYVSGVEARQAGKSRSHCPYGSISWRGAWFLAGWHDADMAAGDRHLPCWVKQVVKR